MTTLVPVAGAHRPLGSFATPAGGRPTLPRYRFGTCTTDDLPFFGPHLGEGLRRAVGPTRCTAVVVQFASTDDEVTSTLAVLGQRGQSAQLLTRLRERFDRLADNVRPLGLTPALVIAQCGALWPQTARAVVLS